MMKREAMLAQVRRQGAEPWDLVIVGGGATGLGAALDAVSRSCRVLLLDQGDFAGGTSSRSTKLIHGGVRYLRQGNIPLVRDSLRERGVLLRNAAGVVHSLPFVVPSYRWWDSAFYGAGLKAYDLLAAGMTLSRSRHLSRRETLDRAPGIAGDGLRGGTLYHDAQFDDARLALAIARSAALRGCVLLNHMPVVSLMKRGDGRVAGVHARDAGTGAQFEIHARAVLNATGPFADQIRGMDRAGAPGIITPSRGVHVVLDASFLPGGSALMIPKTDDGRVLFMIPWRGRVLVGTTDTPCAKATADPRASEAEIDYLLDHASRYLAKKPARADVRSVFAGLRPLVHPSRGGRAQETSRVSRDHFLEVSQSGLVTITGGKWTTYRRMAEDAVDAVLLQAGLGERECRTRDLVLDPEPAEARPDSHVHPRLPYGWADFERAIAQEMACTLEDVLSRRTRCLVLDARASLEVAPTVATRLADALGHGPEWVGKELERFRDTVRAHLPANMQPGTATPH